MAQLKERSAAGKLKLRYEYLVLVSSVVEPELPFLVGAARSREHGASTAQAPSLTLCLNFNEKK